MSGATEKCPKCGSAVQYGYGLAGGGIGPYRYCDGETCDYFEKTQDDDAPTKAEEKQ